jgi:drug/metabolite transporter (DMT)-like permease
LNIKNIKSGQVITFLLILTIIAPLNFIILKLELSFIESFFVLFVLGTPAFSLIKYIEKRYQNRQWMQQRASALLLILAIVMFFAGLIFYNIGLS